MDASIHGRGTFWAAILLCVGLSGGAGCATSTVHERTASPEAPRDALNLVLVIKGMSESHVTHAWMPEEEVEWPAPEDWEAGARQENPVEPAAVRPRDCDQEQIDCVRDCWKRTPPYPYRRKRHDHLAYCEEKCLREYMDCLAATRQARREFPTVNDAIEWMKHHPTVAGVGTVIFVAGLVFVVVSVAGGVLILAPVAIF